MTRPIRSEQEVLQGLTANELELLRRVLHIERAKLHLRASVPTDEILTAVKEIVP